MQGGVNEPTMREFLDYVLSSRTYMMCTTLVAVPLTAYLLFKHYWVDMSDEHDSEAKRVNECMFFSIEGSVCRKHFHQKKVNCHIDSCPFRKIRSMIDHILSAQNSLDVCLYLITVEELADAIVKVYKRGVRVRIITDEDMANNSGSQMILFRQEGIRVRNPEKTTTLMHHKFLVIDKRILMTGSLNWTMQAVCGNWDNLIITSHPPLVRGFAAEFDRLWEVFNKTC